MTTTPDDADALFGTLRHTPPPPPPPPVFPTVSPAGVDARKEQRVKVAWPGRVQLPNGSVLELRVRDLSESGVGLITEHNVPAHSVLNFAMAVPALDEGGKMTPVTGTIRTTYMVVQGLDICCGGMWVNLSADSRELLNKWIRRLRK